MVKILVLVIGLLVVLGGAAVGGMAMGVVPDVFRLFPGRNAEPPPPPPPPTVRDRLGPPPFLLSMKPLEIPVIQDGQVKRRLSLRLRLNMEQADMAVLSERGHLLHTAFFQDLMIFIPQHLENRTTVDLALLKARFQKVADRVAGPGAVKDVVIHGYFER